MIKFKWYNTLDFVCLLSQKSIHTVNSVCKIGKKNPISWLPLCLHLHIFVLISFINKYSKMFPG